MSLIFFISGASGLIFEVVWFDRAGLVFGSSAVATTVVLSSFMAGLAAGSVLAARFGARCRAPLYVYAVLQVIIAVSGLLATEGLAAFMSPIAYGMRLFQNSPGGVNAVRFAAAFIALVIPTSALGATLPMIVTAQSRSDSRTFGATLGRLYGWNTMGAVAGALGTEVILIEAVGINGSAWVAALLSLGAGMAAFLLPQPPPDDAVVPENRKRERGGHTRLLLACAFLSGAALLSLEVVWARFLSLFVVSSSLSLSLILGVVLAGIGAGGLAASRMLRGRTSAAGVLPATAFLTSWMLMMSYTAFQFLAEGMRAAEWYRILWCAAVLSLPTAILSGALFTLIGAALAGRMANTTRAAASVALANTLGGIAGPPMASFVVLPMLGMERAFFILAVTYVGIGCLAMADSATGWRTTAGRLSVLSGVGALCLLATFRFGLMRSTYLPRAVQAYASDDSAIVTVREGVSETVVLMQKTLMAKPLFYRLMTNSVSMSGTQLAAKRYMRYFAYWPMLLHAAPLRRVLVVCYGVGVTTAAATDVSTAQTIDVVEISRDVIAVSDLMYPRAQRPLSDPRVHLHIEDGRHFLQTTTEHWDLITGEPPPPLTPGTVHLYTREYFQLAHDRLAPQGIVTYWLPVARRGEYDLRPIISAFCDVFSDCSLWNGTPLDWMLVGSRDGAGPVTEARLDRFWQDPVLAPKLREIGFERPEQVGATFLGDAVYLRGLTSHVPPLTDNYPQRLRPRQARLSGHDGPSEASAADLDLIAQVINPSRARNAFGASPFIRERWPKPLLERTAPYFDQQAALNRVLLDGASPLRHIEDVHALLTQTTLHGLPLWSLGSDDVQQQIADTGEDDGGYFVPYSLGVRALVARDYGAAAEWFAEAEQRGLRTATVRPLLVYALCLAGEISAARQLSQGDMPLDPDRRHFWTWLGTAFHVGPGSVQAWPAAGSHGKGL